MATRYMFDIGRIEIRNDECFWILPTNYIFDKTIDFITSPWFTHLREKWRMVLCLCGMNEMLNLWLRKEFYCDLTNCKYTVQFELETSDVHRTVFRKGELKHNYGFEASNFCSRTDIYYCVQHSGQIKIFFSINEKHDVDNIYSSLKESEDVKVEVSEEKVKKENPEAKGIDRLVQNLKKLLLNGENSDVTLKVDDHEFRAHRCILAVRSPVFFSMLQHDTKERISGIVDIPDCSVEAFEIFLCYIYTGSVDTISSDKVCDLYYIADKYQVDDLKSECVEFMEENLSVENFCEIMTLSLLHSEQDLQKTAIQFFGENVKTIIKTVQWQKYMKDYTVQANELFIKAISA